MRATKVLSGVILAFAIPAGLYTAYVIHHGLSANGRPTMIEQVLARTARHLATPASSKNQPNPVLATAENITEGRHHFADHCATCHANDGSGQTEIGRNLYPKAPDMRLPTTQNLSDGEIFYIVQNGVRLTGMPAWSDSHQPEDTWKLVLFIRHLPTLTLDEEKEMQRFNPVSDADREEERKEEQFLDCGNPSPAPEEHHHHD